MGALISVIVPVFNKQDYIFETLASIGAQTYSEFEVLIIDDGSTDGSAKICMDFSLSDPRFKYYHKYNSGVADARNMGLECATGDYIAFVDADDSIAPNYLYELYNALISYGTDISASNIHIRDIQNNLIISYVNTEKVVVFSGSEFCELQNELIACSLCNKLFNKSVFQRVRFPSKMLFEDNFIFHEIYGQNQSTVVFINQGLYTYYQSDGSITRNEFSFKRYKDHIEGLKRRIDFFISNEMSPAARITQDLLIDYIAGSYFKDRMVRNDRLTKKVLGDYLLKANINWKTKVLLLVNTVVKRFI